MIQTRLLLLVVLASLAGRAHADDPAPTPTLYWSNGEKLTGELVSATADTLTWRSGNFLDPLVLNWSAIDRIDGSTESHASDEPFAISLRDGSFIFGDVTSVSPDAIGVRNATGGDTTLKRAEVLAIRRIKGQGTIYQGPTGDIGWTPLASQPDGSLVNLGMPDAFKGPLACGPGGALVIRSWNRGGRLAVDLPEKMDVEVDLRSTQRPEFMLALGGDPRSTLRLETWNDNLVLAADNKFHFIRKLQATERELALRIDWDRTTQQCLVFGPLGEPVADWKVPFAPTTPDAHPAPAPGPQVVVNQGIVFNHGMLLRVDGGVLRLNGGIINRRAGRAGQNSGLCLQNRGLDLTLGTLLINPWNGKPAPKITDGQTLVERVDGRVVAGALLGGSVSSIQQQTAQGIVNTPLSEIASIVLSPTFPQPSKAPATFLGLDGTIVRGALVSVADGNAKFATSFSLGLYPASLQSFRRLTVHGVRDAVAGTPPSLDQFDKITINGSTLHGSTDVAPDGMLRWKPLGATAAVRLSPSVSSEITRVLPAVLPAASGDSLFYLTSGDIIPGKMGTVDRTGAEITSPIISAHKIAPGQLRAVQFMPAASTVVQGFLDPGWTVLTGTEADLHRESGRIDLAMGSSIGHPALMQSSEIRFKYATGTGPSGLRLRMFCDGLKPDPSLNLLMLNTGGQLICGLESPLNPGQFENQTQVTTKPGEDISVMLKIEESMVRVFVNDSMVQEIPVTPADRAGTGLILEANNVWQNNAFVATLTDFSAKSAMGLTWLPVVNPEVRNQVITVPRSQRDDPPRHALLAANGDVLRGELEAATDTTFRFRTGLESLDIPRDHVRAVIWLKPPDPNAPPPPDPADKKDDLLQQLIPMRVMFGMTQAIQYLSFIQDRIPGFKYKLPPDGNVLMIQGGIGNQTLGDALAVICSRFNLQYTIGKDGVFNFQRGDAPLPPDLVQKSYWIKPGTFPAQADVQAILTAKGLSFGDGSSVTWKADAGLLSMSNTGDNQAKLATLIDSAWGGSLGSPTDWLQLTSGGRLTLAVDSFAHDTITGHSPAYGTIQVPLDQVMVIRTSPPKESSASKSLQGWQLVNAPEPVIPDSAGGESSPMLGKDAPAFDLPRLAGGNFTLDEQKGHIVVVDFWASWCAPCVQSLPALIASVGDFPADRIKLIGVNQGEAPEQVKRFLTARDLKLDVALDSSQEVGRKYGVDAIPHTVVVGPDGKIAWEATGYDPDGESAMVDVIKQLLKTGTAAEPATPVVH